MATLTALRTRLRARLEEAAPAVWTDTELDECLAGAIEEYSWRFPREVVTTLTLAEGATSAALPAGTRAVERVVLADGAVLPRRGAPAGHAGREESAWEVFGGTLWFTVPLPAQTLALWLRADAGLAELPAADEGLVVALALVAALEQRAVQDLKRGRMSDDGLLRRLREQAQQALAARSRRLRQRLVAP